MPTVFLKEFRERLAKFGLELHPDKTRLIEFGRFAARDRKQQGKGKPETFTFLGFTHYCGQRHKNGTFTVWRITAKKRMVAKLKAIKVELQRRMHDRMAEIGAWLRKVVLGYLHLFLGTRLSCASSNFAYAGCGRVFWSAAASVQRCVGNALPQS